MKTKTTVQQTAVTPTAPGEQQAFERFGSAFSEVHADAATRTAWSDEDRARLEPLPELATEAIRAAQREFSTWGELDPDGLISQRDRNLPDFIGELPRKVSSYIATSTGTTNVQVGAETIATPAIESPAVRLHLTRLGDEIRQIVERAIREAAARVERLKAATEANDRRIAFWLAEPVTRALLHALCAQHAEAVSNGDTSVIDEPIYEAMRSRAIIVKARPDYREAFGNEHALNRVNARQWFARVYAELIGRAFVPLKRHRAPEPSTWRVQPSKDPVSASNYLKAGSESILGDNDNAA